MKYRIEWTFEGKQKQSDLKYVRRDDIRKLSGICLYPVKCTEICIREARWYREYFIARP